MVLVVKNLPANIGDLREDPCTEKVRGCRFCDYEAYCYPRQGDADDLLPGTGEGEIPPDDVFQTDLFSWEPSPDSEQSQTSF